MCPARESLTTLRRRSEAGSFGNEDLQTVVRGISTQPIQLVIESPQAAPITMDLEDHESTQLRRPHSLADDSR